MSEYEKLTGEKPGIWKIAQEETKKAKDTEIKLRTSEIKMKEVLIQLDEAITNNKEKEDIIIKLQNENRELANKFKHISEENVSLRKEQSEIMGIMEKTKSLNKLEKETKATMFAERVRKLKGNIKEKNTEILQTKRLLKSANIKIRSLTESVEILDSENGELSEEVRKERSYWKARMLDYTTIDL